MTAGTGDKPPVLLRNCHALRQTHCTSLVHAAFSLTVFEVQP